MAVAQVTAKMQGAAADAAGTFPANVLKCDGASLPILQLAFFSKTLRGQEMLDLGNNFIRPRLGTCKGRPC
jgi:hypothetical protein